MPNPETGIPLEALIHEQNQARQAVFNLDAANKRKSKQYDEAVRYQEAIDLMVERARQQEGRDKTAA